MSAESCTWKVRPNCAVLIAKRRGCPQPTSTYGFCCTGERTMLGLQQSSSSSKFWSSLVCWNYTLNGLILSFLSKWKQKTLTNLDCVWNRFGKDHSHQSRCCTCKKCIQLATQVSHLETRNHMHLIHLKVRFYEQGFLTWSWTHSAVCLQMENVVWSTCSC